MKNVTRNREAGLIVAALLLAGFLAVTDLAHARGHALLIGIDSYQGTGFSDLKGAGNDVALMRAVLLTPRLGFKPEEVTVLRDSQATHTAIRKALEELAAKVGPDDRVYIHYAGHGSRTCDLNGDEAGREGLDSTLVTYGSRPPATSPPSAKQQCDPASAADAKVDPNASMDAYDLLDDELNELLGLIAARCPNVVFVSDSCHSGTITRGAESLRTRGVAMDARPHPLGARSYNQAKASWVAIGSARDKEAASEYHDRETGRQQGAFTWFWAKALETASPTDTWRDAFRRASAMMANDGLRQQPRMDGDGSRPVGGGSAAQGKPRYCVLSVSSDGTTATIDAGALLGMTRGSVLRKAGQDPSQGTLTITELDATGADGTVQGAFKPGDLLEIDRYMPSAKPLAVYLRADLPQDKSALDALRKHLERNMPAVEVVESQAAADVVLWILRPKQDASGKPVYAREGDSLPQSFEDAQPQCWVLSPDEMFSADQGKLHYALDGKGQADLVESLGKIVRMRGLLSLQGAPGMPASVNVKVHVFVPHLGPAAVSRDCTEFVELDGAIWKRTMTVNLADLAAVRRPAGKTALLFEAENLTELPLHFYVINISKSGQVLAVPFDRGAMNPTDTIHQIQPGQTKMFCRGGLYLTEAKEYVRVLTSREPVDVRLLEQGALRSAKRAVPNPLETLFEVSSGKQSTRGLPAGGTGAAEWSTMLGEFVAE
ncbi:hypothetical protein NNJEOMEG_00071 [Fundidesulfovibrio magnetotacticus]|uniref:Peptidase C14 caspase domain-containing protein n=1 Tax=Fundidesulfovibrio magnetotacticus TaxID=2730080 RepID=A0A6V8LQ53_9BACT|nr:caspase family protein [Fundidesulfovibrio magnetotacticus]GFK92249.1 hypothetical protein NNJEOMEG_00071 [Fundidesulfovibrio magnetotacticus]